jgi:UrcA family protein
MRRILFGVAASLFACIAIVSSAGAQQIEGVDVAASRIVKEKVGTAMNLAPIYSISLSYRVSYADLDLGTKAGAAALEKRVQTAAAAACKEVRRVYPESEPGDSACAKNAVDEAMVRVREVVAAASAAPKK